MSLAWTRCLRCAAPVHDAAFCGPCLAWYSFERTATELRRLVADGLWPPPEVSA